MPDDLDRLAAALEDRYRLERQLGQGGMATVYLAEDVRHHRKVALKVLKPELAAVLGADRFVQEIRTTASLQHPHILPLFDSGEADSFLYYVMPYIEGETLRERLDREKQLGIEDAVRLTTEIADALDYAHGQNVIHRDIKPENILLHNGRPLVADFGIALAVSAAAGGRMTETGLSLGTPHYMSPEQATADRDLTSRSDIYSLGAMLYEMLTGDPPHTGSTAQQVIAKIVTEEPPPVTKARRSVPPNVAAAVAMALEKLPADRFVSAKAFADALEDAGFHTTTTGARVAGGRVAPANQTMWRGAAIAASLVALGAVAFGLWAWQRRPAMPTVRLSVAFPAGQQIRPVPTRRFAFSRDGSRLVYVGPDSVGGSQLWVRDVNSLTGRPLAGTSGALGPFFSPDAESVAYFTGSIGDLRVVSVAGGAPRTLVRDSALAFGGSWCDGEIYFTAGPAAAARISERGGAYEIISHPDTATGVVEHDWLQCLPEGGVVLAQLWRSAFTNAELGLIDIASGAVTPLVQGVYGRYVPSGHLLYATAAGTLYRVPLNLRQRRVIEQPVIVADGVQLDPSSGAAQFDVSDNGVLGYMSGGEGTQRVVWVDRAGRQTPADSGWRGQFTTAELSPDDRRLALSLFGGGELQVAIKDLPAGPLSRLSAGGLIADRPAWTPDGRWLAFITSTANTGSRTAMIRRADGSVPAETLLAGDRSVEEVEFMPDGQRFLVRLGAWQGGRDIMIGNRRDSVLQPLLATPADEYAPAVSPDGRWFAYASGESGRAEVYVRSVDEPGAGRTQISTDGGDEPRWARSGREVYYRSRSGDMMAAEVAASQTFTARPPRRLFSASGMAADPFHHTYSVSRDGRFLMISQMPEGGNLVMVFNWAEELQERR